MPFKHQTESFRTRGGVRYECDGDICDTAHGDLRKQAAQRVRDIRATGSRAFFEKQEGFYRVFRRDPVIVRYPVAHGAATIRSVRAEKADAA